MNRAKFVPILMVAISGLLSGCAPAVLVAGAATVGGAIIYDKRSYTTMAQDQNARVVAQERLDRSPVLADHSHISISVFNGVGLLIGQAQTAEVREEAGKLVSNIRGIQVVYNKIVIGSPTTALERTKDAWITTKVRAAMLGASGLQSTNLKVITENREVYLMGMVTREQAQLATDVARTVSDVTKVVTVFSYE